MNNKQIAHLWANKSRNRANGSHFYFEGDTIYSYGSHFPIARHYKGTVLMTTETYSVSTTRHVSYTRQACSHLPVFHVVNVMNKPGRADVNRYALWIDKISTQAARARNPQFHLDSLQGAIGEANKFCATFGFKTRFSMPDDKTLSALKEKAKLASAKAAKATAKRNAKIAKDNEKSIGEWIAGELHTMPAGVAKVYLRKINRTAAPKPEILEMQTSKGASVDLGDAHNAFRFVMLKRKTGWHRNGETFKVGDFQLDAVNEQGVIAGCHRIEWDEIERFAKTQGWLV